MNLVLEKQRIKQELDMINDESIILTIKKILGLSAEYNLKALTKEDILTRAIESEKAIKEGNILTLQELEAEMKNW